MGKVSRLAWLILFSLWIGVAAAAPKAGELKIFVTAAFVSEKGLPVYREIADYLGTKIGRRISVVSGASYSEVDMLLEHGIVHVGFVCGLPYIHEFYRGKYSLLAIPVSAVRTGVFADIHTGYENTPGKYYSYTIVHKDSKARSWEDLRGKRYVFNDVNSNSGYNMPRYKLLQLGEKRWDRFFSKVLVSGSHEESIRMVARGVVDASSVDSLVLDYDRFIGDPDALNVRVIEQLFPGGAGAPPVVVSNKLPVETRQQLQEALVNMDKDPVGRKILEKSLLARFAPPNDANYDDIRAMDYAARRAGFVDHDER